MLGVAHHVGSDLCYWVLNNNGKVLVHTTVQYVVQDDCDNPEINLKIDKFNKDVNNRLDDENFIIEGGESKMYLYDATLNTDKENGENKYQQPEVDDYTPEGYDELISAEVLIPKGDQSVLGTVIGRKRDSEGNPVGIRNANPILDTREYDVMLPDGSTVAYDVNTIVENIYSQVDANGRQYSIIEELINHAKEHTVLDKKNGFIRSRFK